MFKKYYLLLIMVDGAYANTYIEGSITSFINRARKNKNFKTVVLKSWRISKHEYKELKKEATK